MVLKTLKINKMMIKSQIYKNLYTSGSKNNCEIFPIYLATKYNFGHKILILSGTFLW